MSTVQSILDATQFRLDYNADLFHLINTAIRMIAKRLYILESSVITADLNTSVFATVDYTASLAFVNSNPDTITDAAAQFVIEGFEAGMYMTTSSTTNPGPYKLNTVVAGTLTLVSTDSVTAAVAASTTLTSVDEYFALPSDFWGLKQNPWLNGQKYVLQPLPNQEVALQLNTAGLPQYYDIKGTKIYLYPPPSSDYTLNGDYFQRPTSVSAVTDTIPFNEIFDDAIAEALVMLYDKGQANQGEVMLMVQKVINDYVDMIAPKYDRNIAQGMPEGLDWDALV